jgi:glutamyl-tRNA synthetase
LFNWLFARQLGGQFVLRIEDTDTSRNRPEHIEGILRALEWLGLDWDEGPFFQSQRGDLYTAAIQKLIDDGAVYACDCRPEAIQKRAKEAGRSGYDGHCRDLGKPMTVGHLLRFRVPPGESGFTDLIRKDVPSNNKDVEDFGVRKSNGDPLFILANVVDDADMRISHVIRGADHVSNTHKYVLLWRALGYGPEPVFAHLPLINNDQGRKLSKRKDKVAVEDYRDEGYLSEALRNYLALLGWSPGDDREKLTVEEMISEFRLEDVKSAPAKFDEKKLSSVNKQYILAMTPDELVERAQAWLRARWAPVAAETQERARTLAQVFTMTEFIYRPEPVLDAAAWNKESKKPGFAPSLQAAVAAFVEVEWDAASIEEALTAMAEALDVKIRDVQSPIRLAVMGGPVGLPLYQSLELLGRDRTLARLRVGLERLQAGPLSV